MMNFHGWESITNELKFIITNYSFWFFSSLKIERESEDEEVEC